MIGIAFLFALAFDQLPAESAVPAGNGDIASGIAALAVVLSPGGNGTLTRGRLYALTTLGVADFLVANTTGLSSNRRPSPPGRWPSFPTIVIPFFAVLHLVAVLHSRHNWNGRVHHDAIRHQAETPTPTPSATRTARAPAKGAGAA